MKKKYFLVLITILSLGVSSCSYFESFNDKRKEAEEASKPTIKVTAAGKKKAEEDAKKAQEPTAVDKAVQEAEKVKRDQEIVGLIPPTNPEIRVRGSIRGRPDPFSTIAVIPEIEIKEEEIVEPNASRNSDGNNRSNRPESITSTPTIETLEPPEVIEVPRTELANNVLITGLVELGGRIQVILQAPEEATSRYVEIGQYISNGRVLVKRVESSLTNPRVILEESGIEVAREVGQPREEETEEQASLQNLSPNDTSMSWLSNYLAQKSQ